MNRINRAALCARHDPVLKAVEFASPLSVGNGEFAFTADVTGLQTLNEEYTASGMPLCTMAQWGWHTGPGGHSMAQLTQTEYSHEGREVRYPVQCKPGEEEVYGWLRQNPHRLNLARVGLVLHGAKIRAGELTAIEQRLDLYKGILHSRFVLAGSPCRVQTCVNPASDTLAVKIQSPLLQKGLGVELCFPYGSPDISGADWERPEAHSTELLSQAGGEAHLRRLLDGDSYYVALQAPDAQCSIQGHRLTIQCEGDCLAFTVIFSPKPPELLPRFEQVRYNTAIWWQGFWEQGAAVELAGSTNPRAKELERRIVLSQYLLAIQCAGSLPPQETGLTCNSWYGKFHLEMTPLHLAHWPLWGRPQLLERCLPWYKARLPAARQNARKNGYKGARWPKMIGPEGEDSPSPIAPLLLWQQPHILFMLELLAEAGRPLKPYMELIFETAVFMADFAVQGEDGLYHLTAPLIPVQEEFDPRTVCDPAFELEYWRYGLLTATRLLEGLGETPPTHWREVAEKMALPAQRDGLYLAHADCPDTFEKYTRDHPSMLMACGFLRSERLDRAAMQSTLQAVCDTWLLETLWGWDFAMLAMSAARLGQPQKAIELLLWDTPKNSYVQSGINYQKTRADLPLYLPGNGSLLLAVSMLADTGAFAPQQGWELRTEGLCKYPL